MTDAKRGPQVGDSIQLRGLSRLIFAVDSARNKVLYTNPPTCPVPDYPSREGSCALSELKPMETPDGTVWYLAGTLEAKTPRAGAIELEPAMLDINAIGGTALEPSERARVDRIAATVRERL